MGSHLPESSIDSDFRLPGDGPDFDFGRLGVESEIAEESRLDTSTGVGAAVAGKTACCLAASVPASTGGCSLGCDESMAACLSANLRSAVSSRF